MFFPKAVYCRAFQTLFRAALPILPYREPETIDSCEKLGSIFTKEHLRSVLIVTDKGIVRSGLLSYIEDVLKSCEIKYAVYADTQPNPTVQNVEDALNIYKYSCCDTIIAIGGGSAIDCAKAVGARAVYPKKSVNQLGGMLKVLRSLPILIAVPTTAGTGSETTLAALITNPDAQHKYALMSFPLIPRYAVLDPKLTYSLPQGLTATTGMDALTHAIEAYIGRSTTKETRRLALEASKLIFENIEIAYKNGYDNRARENMLRAAYKAGIAFSKSYVGYIHAIAHSLGGKYGIPHGLANAVIMPYILESYGKSAHKKLYKLGLNVGVCTEADSYEDGANKFIKAVSDLNSRLEIPCKLSGIKAEDIPEMAHYAEKEANPLYPVPKLMTQKELEEFYIKISDRSE